MIDYAALNAGPHAKALVDEAMDSLRTAGCPHPRIKLTASVGAVPQLAGKVMQRMEAYCPVCDLHGKSAVELSMALT